MTIPKHVALIPDGNRRWAKKHHLPALIGHERGYERVREFVTFARSVGVECVTVWAFSTENWKRKQEEVDDLMNLVAKGLYKIHEDAKKEKTRVVHIGRRDRLHEKLRLLIEEVEEATKMYNEFCVCIAIDYGGEDELERASKLLCEFDDASKVLRDFLDTEVLSLPFVDLVIRTGGEKRTSGFMLLQTAYAEWVFEESLFPDFDEDMCKKALTEYQSRTRRFGA